MKRRNRAKRQRTGLPQRKALSMFAARHQRKRKPWTFERLEDRHCFSVGPQNLQLLDLEAGADQENAQLLHDLQWAIQSATDGNSRFSVHALPTDPLFASQWHLLNTGQEVGNPDFQRLFGVAGEDINVVPVWNEGITGEGVVVAVIDTGVQLFHPDLTDNIHPTLRLNAITGTNNASPSLFDPVGGHGTSVAGLIAATGDNSQGGIGVAPGATIVPIRIGIGFVDVFSPAQIANALQYVIQNGIDITNNSWGPNHAFDRHALPMTPAELAILRDSVVFGREGLGVIHVFSSGNDAGPAFSPGFTSFGNYDSASYNPYVNSRYTIGVTGVDHDGQYINADGTFTSYPAAGASVLVAAPTGSNVAQTVADDEGQGSGIWTTDLVDDFGFNAEALPNGFDPDRDLLPDPDYTSRFNGTSAAAPIVSGVIALMLEANPNLTYRDVQEILVRSARQNAQFEQPRSGGLGGSFASQSTWQVNQIGPFRNPDPYDFLSPFFSVFDAFLNPLADVNAEGLLLAGGGGIGFEEFAPDTNDIARQFFSNYEPQPPVFTNGAGYTVSQGYGVYAEQIGYAHGVIDAELAVSMAKQWHDLGQNLNPFTEKTFTTFFVRTNANVPAAERGTPPGDGIGFMVPGGWYGLGGYIAYWNEYFEDDPFADYDGPPPTQRGDSYIDFAVQPDQAIDVEWVEVRVDISGPAEDLDFLRLSLVSPDGTASELNHFYFDGDFPTPRSFQPISIPPGVIDPAGDIDVDGGTFVWTFSTNRHWGESTNSTVVIDPVTGEPVLQDAIDFETGMPTTLPIFRNWEIHLENWSNSTFGFNGIEVVWHGKPIANGRTDPNWNVASAQRVQGFVGIDTNADDTFNYSRYIQTVTDTDGDPDTIRLLDVQRVLDFTDVNDNGVYEPNLGDTINQEPFAENIIVEAFRVDPVTGIVDDDPTAQFLTGADGNYYFDLDSRFEYEIRIIDPLGRTLLDDNNTPSQYMPKYLSSWRVTPDWYFAPDRDNPLLPGDNPAEIFYGLNDANGDGEFTEGPLPFLDIGEAIPMAVKNVNFLLKQDAPPQQFDVVGTVYADFNANGVFDGDDAPAAGIFVYHDANRNKNPDAGETRVETDANGQYTLTIFADHIDTYAVGVIPPTGWVPTDPGGDAVENVFAGPGSPDQVVIFFLDPPHDPAPDGGTGPGNITGLVFNDLDTDRIRDAGEVGLPGFRVFIDADEDGAFDAGELEAITASNGSFFFADVPPGLHRIDIVIANEGTENASWRLTTPVAGFRQVDLGPGGTVTGVVFGVENRASRDWGDLPDTYSTLSSSNGPNHALVPGFHLGTGVDGEVNGLPTPNADGDDAIGSDDNGVVIVSNGGALQVGSNLLQVTVSGVGGLLNAWMDINANGQFDTGEQVVTDQHLNPGVRFVTVNLPSNTASGPMAARFRWGEAGLSFTGPAGIGEVEDYFLPSSVVPVVVLAGDYNVDGMVDGEDYLVWKSTFGSTTNLAADDNQNGVVDAADMIVWRKNVGAGNAQGTAGGASVDEPAAAAVSPEVRNVHPTYWPQATWNRIFNRSQTSPVITPVDEAPEGETASIEQFVSVVDTFDTGSNAALSRASFRPLSRVLDGGSADASLLLLDEAWAELDGEDASSQDEPAAVGSDGDEALSELALAAVFEEETEWWNAL